MSFIRSFQSEWIKRRRSLASWLIVVGALFMPAMTLLRLINDREKLPELYAQENFWSVIWGQNWQSMNLMLTRGAEVTNVMPGCAAAKAGAKKGDVSVSIDGKPVRGQADYIELARECHAVLISGVPVYQLFATKAFA